MESRFKELGSCECVIGNIRTLVDGSCRISLDLDPQAIDIITKLIKMKMANEQTIYVGFAIDTKS